MEIKNEKKNIILGMWNVLVAIIFILDKYIGKETISPFLFVLWMGLFLSGMFLILDYYKKKRNNNKMK